MASQMPAAMKRELGLPEFLLPESQINSMVRDYYTDENFAGNASGVAIKYKLLAFENISRIKEREFKRGLQRRLELLCNFWQFQGRGAWDWRGVAIQFHRALPENLLELSQVVSNLSDVVSDETKRGMLPLPVDEDTEKARLEEQYGGSLFSTRERKTGEPDDEVS